MKDQKIKRAKEGRFYFRFKGGESGCDVYERAAHFIEYLKGKMDNYKSRNSTFIIVTHGLYLRFFLMRFLNWNVDTLDKMRSPKNCEIFVLEKGDDYSSNYNLVSNIMA